MEKLYVLYNPIDELYITPITSATPAFESAKYFANKEHAEKFLNDDAWMALGRFFVYSFQINLVKE